MYYQVHCRLVLDIHCDVRRGLHATSHDLVQQATRRHDHDTSMGFPSKRPDARPRVRKLTLGF